MRKLLFIPVLATLLLCGCEQLQIVLNDQPEAKQSIAVEVQKPERRQLENYNNLDDVLVFQDGSSGIPVYVRFAFVPYADSYPEGYWRHYPLAKSLLLDIAEGVANTRNALNTSELVASIHDSFIDQMETRFAGYQIEPPFADLVIYRVSNNG